MVMSLAQDGDGYPFFAPSMFDYICGRDIGEVHININHVPDCEVPDFLLKVELWPVAS